MLRLDVFESFEHVGTTSNYNCLNFCFFMFHQAFGSDEKLAAASNDHFKFDRSLAARSPAKERLEQDVLDITLLW